MSDLVLARKYRPRSFDQMVGQSHVVQALTNALNSGRLHHAYLFTGTRGIGKTTVSRILAKSLNCTGADGQGGVTANPCGQCAACTEIDADRFIDYIELDAASNRSIDEIRDLIERAAYKPSVGRYKVFMIDEAHQLTKDAFNALLKTLEEPPDYLKFVLATTDPEKMLPTVLSRCLQFNLRPMAPEVVHAHLQAVLQAEAITADAGSLRLLARAARGSMRDALSLTDQAIAYGAGQLDEAGVRAMLGTVDRQHAQRLVLALAQRDGAAMLLAVDGLRQLGLSASGTLEEMAMLLQQMAVEQAVPGALDEHDPDTAGARQLACELPADETHLLYSIVLGGRPELHLLADEYAAMTMVLLRMLAFPAQPTDGANATRSAATVAPLHVAPREARSSLPARMPSSLPARLPSSLPALMPVAPPPKAMPKQAPAVKPPSAAAAPVLITPVAPTATVQVPLMAAANDLPSALGDRWSALIRPLISDGSIAALVRELALQSQLLGVDRVDDTELWHLRVEREALRHDALRDKLQAALQAVHATPLRIDVVAGAAEDSLAQRDAQTRAHMQREAEALIRADPVVKGLMAQFASARIVPGSIKPITTTSKDSP